MVISDRRRSARLLRDSSLRRGAGSTRYAAALVSALTGSFVVLSVSTYVDEH